MDAPWGEIFIHGLGSILALLISRHLCVWLFLMTNPADFFSMPQCSTLGARFLFTRFHVNVIFCMSSTFPALFLYFYSHPDFQDYLQVVCMSSTTAYRLSLITCWLGWDMTNGHTQQLENLLKDLHLYLTVFLLTLLSKIGTWCYLFVFFAHGLAALILFSIHLFFSHCFKYSWKRNRKCLKYVDSIDMVVRPYYILNLILFSLKL